MSNQIKCVGNSPFFGCRFSLYPMTDNFVEVILDAVKNIKRPGLELEVGDVSTCVMGLEKNVFGALKSTLADAASTKKHIVMSTTFSKGCPGEGLIDIDKYRKVGEANPLSNTELSDPVTCEFSIYPMGSDNYMSTIYQIIQYTKDLGIYAGSEHFVTRLSGSIDDVFTGLEKAFKMTTDVASHVIMQAILSCNSPSNKKGEL